MPDPQFVAAIVAGGQTLTGWENVTVKRSFHDGISTFEFGTTENIFGPGTKTPQLQPGDPVTITLGGQQVINGKVTTRAVAYDADSHQIVISGKSLTKDVKDSSVQIKQGDYSGSTFEQVARSVLQPHGVGLVVRNPPPIFTLPFKTLAVQYGETAGALLSRLAPMRGVFLSDDAMGNLVAGQGNPAAAPVAELQEGVNILRAAVLLDDQTAFGQYAFASQQPDPTAAAAPRWYSATMNNPNVAQNRVKLAIAEHPASAQEL